MATLLPTSQIEQDKDEPQGGIQYLERVRDRLFGVMRESTLSPIERSEAGRVLAKLGDPRPSVLDPLQIDWRAVPAGSFKMGNDLTEYDIPYEYKMACYPVTNAQFAAFVAAGGYSVPEFWKEANSAGYWTDQGFKGSFDDMPRFGTSSSC